MVGLCRTVSAAVISSVHILDVGSVPIDLGPKDSASEGYHIFTMAKREGYEAVAADEDAETNYLHQTQRSLPAWLGSRLGAGLCVFNILILCLNLFFFVYHQNPAFDVLRCTWETSYWCM